MKQTDRLARPATAAVLALALCAVLALPAAAQEEMSEDAMAEAMAKLAPGEQHAELAKLAGDWTAAVTMWPTPGAEPVTSQGKASYRMVLDGRYLEQTFEGSMMGTPFRGLGYTGYDNLTGEYVTAWMDTLSTGITFATGKGEMDMSTVGTDPMTGADLPMRMVTEIVSDTKHVFTMFMTTGGQEYKAMEIAYTRK